MPAVCIATAFPGASSALPAGNLRSTCGPTQPNQIQFKSPPTQLWFATPFARLSMSTHRQNVLRAYRELLTLIKRLPIDQRHNAWQEARSVVRQQAGEPDPVKQSDMLKEMVAKISFLRVITPRVAGEKSATGAGHWVMRNGELVEGEGVTAGQRVADGKISVEEAHQRHNQLLKRQFFGREPPPYNPSSF